ncbi:hypothetical protein [Oligoflexus tunisiensis]|uniref:hypothetical protein n=1 Tax=Oligoflexus tunisiensis TaxID=708132 RepID=UPI00114CA859|nr:hypothetical protein [Oligoflexus tunisiensis]
MSLFAVLARRTFIFMLLFLGPLCFVQHNHSGFPEACEHKKSEVEATGVAWLMAQKPAYKKTARAPAFPHDLTSPVFLVRLYRVLSSLTLIANPPAPLASRCLPMLC